MLADIAATFSRLGQKLSPGQMNLPLHVGRELNVCNQPIAHLGQAERIQRTLRATLGIDDDAAIKHRIVTRGVVGKRTMIEIGRRERQIVRKGRLADGRCVLAPDELEKSGADTPQYRPGVLGKPLRC